MAESDVLHLHREGTRCPGLLRDLRLDAGA